MAKAVVEFNDTELKKYFAKFKGLDWSRILKAAYMTAGFQDIIEHFKNEQGPSGKWQDRSYYTEYRYAKIFDGEWKLPKGTSKAQFNIGNKILQATGTLRNSILPSKADVKKLNNNSIQVFNNAKYSGIHDTGGKIKVFGKYNATMPQREFMWISSKGMDLMVKVIMDSAPE
jgi:phage gpG-like protein